MRLIYCRSTIGEILNNKDIVIVGKGYQTRCFTYIDDGISALGKIINDESSKLDGKIFNIGNPKNDKRARL
jgi:nucleoside-diphosphate-sugar epimerase